MTELPGSALLLFVAGSFDPPPPPLRRRGRLARGLGGAFLPRGWAYTGPDVSDPVAEAPRTARKLGPEDVTCVNLVLDEARRAGRTVTLINVEAPGDDGALVARWAGPDVLLPLLVRPDGSTLSGSENFVPRAVRRFLAGG
jgi:hypothetical protein